MFSEPRPTLSKSSALDPYPLTTGSYSGSEQKHRYEEWKGSVQQPLRATGQKPGKRVDFFIQGLITGGAIVSFTLILGMGILVNFGYKKVWLSRVELAG